jgi:putative ATPase
MDLFEEQARQAAAQARPLAERMRPQSLESFVGQAHLVGPEGIVRQAIDADRIFSMILWGPPGCGKTTLARIVARETRSHFIHFSAVLSGVKDIRQTIAEAQRQRSLRRKKTLLFVDEIHRFNKAQQDAFLHHVESGLLTLIGATTENPSFEVIPPLLSRCRVVTLETLTADQIREILVRALHDTEHGLGDMALQIEDDALGHLADMADGDARFALNSLEITVGLLQTGKDPVAAEGPRAIRAEDVARAMDKKALVYDKDGEAHYDLISAFHKSLRGSDPDAALYWLQRMLLAGEDPLFIARRMVRCASEDIGNADPQALTITIGAMESYRFLGSPEGELALAQAAVYLATAPKSNRLYQAFKAAAETIEASGSLPVPLHLRNAPTSLMQRLGYGETYRYPHDYPDAVVEQEYLPSKLRHKRFYTPSMRGFEKVIRQRLDWWRQRTHDRALKDGKKH